MNANIMYKKCNNIKKVCEKYLIKTEKHRFKILKLCKRQKNRYRNIFCLEKAKEKDAGGQAKCYDV